MTIPDYQTLMLPVLRACADGRDHATPALVAAMADHFKLDEDERRQTIPSGGQTLINCRTQWAITYMVQARLLERPRRSVVRITSRGRELLARAPERIDYRLLGEFPEFRDFLLRSRSERPPAGPGDPPTEPRDPVSPPAQTPEEQIRSAAAELESALGGELLDRLRAMPPSAFQRLVAQLLVRMGYGSERRGIALTVGASGFGGIDGLVDQDPLGLDRVYVQARRDALDDPVGTSTILEFAHALAQRHAAKGVFITTSRFTDEARRTAEQVSQRIVLIDGNRLAQLMIRHDVGVRIAETLHIKMIDPDFFLEE